jgi:glycosyltransferase involved in cell wall biosynthesis
LRILHCLRTPVGGLFRHVIDLSTEQARRGHLVGLVCDATSGDALTEKRLEGLVPHLALGLFRTAMGREIGWRDVPAYRAIRAHASRTCIDVLHGHGAKGGAYARLTARSLKQAGLPVVSCYTPHGGSLHYHPASIAGRAYMALERQLARHTDALVFESAYSKARYEAQVGETGIETQVIPNGLAAGDFAAAQAPADAADFLFIGELRHLKGVDVMLKALARVREVAPVRAVIVGDGPDAKAVKAEASSLGLDDAVSFPGTLPAREAFALGRALIVPSRAESFPYIVLEAAAAGLPLIATNVGGIPEIVAGTDTTLLPPDDPALLALAMMTILNDPLAAQACASRLKAAVADRFTIEAMTTAVLRLYASVDQGRR